MLYARVPRRFRLQRGGVFDHPSPPDLLDSVDPFTLGASSIASSTEAMGSYDVRRYHGFIRARGRGGSPSPRNILLSPPTTTQPILLSITDQNDQDFQGFDGFHFCCDDPDWKAGGVLLAGGRARRCP